LISVTFTVSGFSGNSPWFKSRTKISMEIAKIKLYHYMLQNVAG
jgi:hypothetical protein